jgi:hypothetical protein
MRTTKEFSVAGNSIEIRLVRSKRSLQNCGGRGRRLWRPLLTKHHPVRLPKTRWRCPVSLYTSCSNWTYSRQSNFWSQKNTNELRHGKCYLLKERMFGGGMRYNSWLRHYVTSWTVAGSIPDEVIGFLNWPYPSSRIMALGSTQSLTEMSASNLPGG